MLKLYNNHVKGVNYSMVDISSIYTAPYFTYFIGPNDLIFYSMGKGTHPYLESIRAVMTYYPHENGDRVLYRNGKRYKSLRVNGFAKDREIVKKLPPFISKTLLSLFAIDLNTKEEILKVPIDGIKYVFNPKQSFVDFINTPPSVKDIDKVTESLDYVLKQINSHGISSDKIGFYGSLQCKLFHKELFNFNDIDLLIYGLDYQDSIVEICKENKLVDYKRLDREDRYLKRIEQRQLDLTEAHFNFNGKNIYLHLTQVRDMEDRNTFPNLQLINFENSESVVRGKVIDSSEAFTSPTVVTVQLEDGKVINVISRYYHFTKSAFKGDLVIVKGLVSKDKSLLLLSDINNHYIINQKYFGRV